MSGSNHAVDAFIAESDSKNKCKNHNSPVAAPNCDRKTNDGVSLLYSRAPYTRITICLFSTRAHTHTQRYLLNFVRKYFNIALAALGGLQIYETPTTEYLKTFAISSKSSGTSGSGKGKKGGKSFASSARTAVEDELLIERSAPIVLDCRSVQASDLSDYVYDIYFEILVNLTVGGKCVLYGLALPL